MALDKLQAQVQPAFSPDGGAGVSIPLQIIGDAGAYGDNYIHLLLIPAVGATISVDVGRVEAREVKPVTVAGGVVTFGGSDTASLPALPGAKFPSLRVLYSFDTSGNLSPNSVTYDNVSNTLRLLRPAHAAVAYGEYETTGRVLLYTPETQTLGKGTLQKFGVIAAFYPPSSQVIHQVEPPTFDNGNIEIELYRRVSGAVTTPDGEFEKPPSYPTTGTYPDRSLVIDVSTSLLTERVHEIGLMDGSGRAWVRNFFVPVKEPYVGDVTYANNLLNTLQYKESTLPVGQFSSELILKAKSFIAQKGYGKK